MMCLDKSFDEYELNPEEMELIDWYPSDRQQLTLLILRIDWKDKKERMNT